MFDDARLSPLCNAHTKIARAAIAGLIASSWQATRSQFYRRNFSFCDILSVTVCY